MRDEAAARLVDAWLGRAAAEIHARRGWLTDLDAAIGDGDHGINLDRGFAAVAADLDGRALSHDPAERLAAAGQRLLGTIGGASGALYGRALIAAGSRLTADVPPGGGAIVMVALEAAVADIVALGHATSGDKTMLDALLPALATLRAAVPTEPAADAVRRAADAAEAGAQATIPLVARRGRASYLGERSAGHLDPGAASSALLLRALADVMHATRTGGGA